MKAKRWLRAWPLLLFVLFVGLWEIRTDLLEIGDAAAQANARLDADHVTR